MTSFPNQPNWYSEHLTPNLVQTARLERVLYSGHTKYQSVSLIETASFGRMLILDGKTQSSESDEFIYHEALVQPAMVAHPRPEHIFVAGGGEGATIREILKHSTVQDVQMVDLDQEVVELCRQYLPNHHAGAFEDVRTCVHFEDALAYLEKTQDRFDIIVIDIPDPLEGGPAYRLYTQEFYRLIQSRLRAGGLVVAQSGPAGPGNCREVFTAIHQTMSSIFYSTFPYTAYIPSFGTVWGFIICGSKDSPNMRFISPGIIDARVAERMNNSLSYYDGETHASLGMLPKYLRKALSEETRLITNNSPLYVV
jgi:spermidine synthase